MTGPDLKPCPFCGEKMPAHDDTSYIRCMGCGAESGWRATPEDVAAAWNRRDPAVLAALPEVKALVAAAYEAAERNLRAYCVSQVFKETLTEQLCSAIGTPADATAALAARDAAMQAKGMREGAAMAWALEDDDLWTRAAAQKAILARAAEIEGDGK